jgi:hypothetical protein
LTFDVLLKPQNAELRTHAKRLFDVCWNLELGTWNYFNPMSINSRKPKGLPELLDYLGELPEEELLAHFTSENIEALRLLADIFKEGMELERVLSEKRFVTSVRELHETKRIWSRRLEETLENAAREYDLGNCIQALWILNGFIRFCPSPHFRELAGEVLAEYEERDN